MKFRIITLTFAVLLVGCNKSNPPSQTAPITPPMQKEQGIGKGGQNTTPIQNPKSKIQNPNDPMTQQPNAVKLANFTLINSDLDVLPYKTDKVAITFDAGADDKATPLILKALKERNLHSTFFLTGFFCRHFPKTSRSIADAGNEIGSHSDTHPHFTKCPDAKIQKELTLAEKTILKICGVDPKPLFRFPYGDRDKRTIADVVKSGYQPVRWTLDSLDAFGEAKSEAFVAGRITSKIKGGDIILMHVSSIGSAKALPRIFAHLEKKGLKPVLVSELLNAIPAVPQQKIAKR